MQIIEEDDNVRMITKDISELPAFIIKTNDLSLKKDYVYLIQVKGFKGIWTTKKIIIRDQTKLPKIFKFIKENETDFMFKERSYFEYLKFKNKLK